MIRYLKILFFSGAIVFLITIVYNTQLSSSRSSKTNTSQEVLNKQYPGEWFYNERAYPNNYINIEAIKLAETQAQQERSAKENSGLWELKGPLNTGGRITDIAIASASDDIFYVAAATGGIFKTTNGGTTFEPIFDNQSKLSIGDIAIAPSNDQILYAGTGEANASVNTGAFFGDGIYKSENAGDTWENIGLGESNHIGRIVVDPTNPDRVFAAATGKLYGYNSERGVYRTTNGGSSWERVLHITDSTAAIDVAMNPQNPDIVFAAMWERTRKPWIRDYAGITSGIHRSMDGGTTWEELGAANGLPAPNDQTGRIGLAVSQSEPSTIYARYTTNQITNVFNGLYKSTDNGENWTLVALNDISFVDASFGWYFGNLRVNPGDVDQVYVLGQQLVRTDNSGGNWTTVGGMHVDHHAMEFSQTNNNFILAGNDGGLYKSNNGGATWDKFLNLPITQFYNIEVDQSNSNGLYGGTQDNNTIRTTTGGQNDWNSIWGGDGFHVNVDPDDNNFIYVESQFGGLGRSIDGGASFQGATAGIDGNDRNNWNTPVVLSNFDPATVYYGTNRLYISNRAEFWTVISPDLTDGQHPSGSLSYGTLTAIGTSHNNTNTVYTGSDDGRVYVTFDGGSTWTDISTGLPDRYITSIAVSPSDDLTAYVALSGYKSLDYDPHIFKTIDGGQNWTAVAGNLPNIPVNDILINDAENLLFAATDLMVWYSETDGNTWTILGDNLPLTLTRDLKLHKSTNTLYAGTYGRSMYSYDLDQIILGTVDNNLGQQFQIAPNPASQQFTIQHQFQDAIEIELIDFSGRTIKEIHQGAITAGQHIDVSVASLPAGIYFVKYTRGSLVGSKKLIIE